MATGYLRGLWLLVATAGLLGALAGAASAGPPGQQQSGAISADFESYVNFVGNPALCSTPGAILVEGRGVATGPFGKFDSAIGTAAECSAGQFDPFDFPAPQLDDCHNIPPFTPYFDVHGQGVYVTKDGSALFLRYHELSENPFAFFPPNGTGLPFFLHDCGTWEVDPTEQSTGIFAGATGHGSISAMVPVRTDFSAHVLATYTPDLDGALTLAAGAKAPKGQGDTRCDGTLTGPIPGNVTVDAGASCTLDYGAVNGDVHVRKGATLQLQYSIAAGNLDCTGCAAVTVNPGTVLGNLHADHAGGTTIVSSKVGGDVDVHNGEGATILLNPGIGHDLRVHDNDGFSMVAGNTAGHTVDCRNNTPAPVLSFTVPFPPQFGVPSPTFTGNDAPELKGQCSLFGLGPQPPPAP